MSYTIRRCAVAYLEKAQELLKESDDLIQKLRTIVEEKHKALLEEKEFVELRERNQRIQWHEDYLDAMDRSRDADCSYW